ITPTASLASSRSNIEAGPTDLKPGLKSRPTATRASGLDVRVQGDALIELQRLLHHALRREELANAALAGRAHRAAPALVLEHGHDRRRQRLVVARRHEKAGLAV